MKHHESDPLPRDWLPDPVGPARARDSAVWATRLERLLAAAEPGLARLRRRRAAWWVGVAEWWRPIAATAGLAAATLVVFLYLGTGVPSIPTRESPALAAIAGEGDMTAVLARLGVGTDPVVALAALEGDQP